MRGRRRHLSRLILISQIQTSRIQISRIRINRIQISQIRIPQHRMIRPRRDLERVLVDLQMALMIPENRQQQTELILTEPGKRIRMDGGMNFRTADMYRVPI